MGSFAFIYHPEDIEELRLNLKAVRKLPRWLVDKALRFLPPLPLAPPVRINSKAGDSADGLVILCPITSPQVATFSPKFAYSRASQALKVAKRCGAGVVGLGSLDFALKARGIFLAPEPGIVITTGRGLAVGGTLEAIKFASYDLEIDLKEAEVLVIGASGAMGSVLARLLAREVKYLTIVGRDRKRLEIVARRILEESGLAARISLDIGQEARRADVIVNAASRGAGLGAPGASGRAAKDPR